MIKYVILCSNISGLTDKARSVIQTRYRSATKMATNVEHSSNISANEVDRVDMLNASFDAYDGVIVNVKENMDENVFTTLLQTSISQWRQQVTSHFSSACIMNLKNCPCILTC